MLQRRCLWMIQAVPFSRHLELGLILLCSVCPMSLNYWFHLVQSMTCRCIPECVWVLFGLAAYAVCAKEPLLLPWLAFLSCFFLFLFFFFSFLLFLSLRCRFPPSFQSDQRYSQVRGVFDLDVSENHVGSDTPQSRAVSRGLRAVLRRSQVGFWNRNQESRKLGVTGRAILGRQNNFLPLTLHYLFFSVFHPAGPRSPPCYFFFSVCSATNTQGPRL